LDELGLRRETLEEFGVRVSQVDFFVGSNWIFEQNARLNLEYRHSAALNSGASNLNVLLNDELIASVQMIDANTTTGTALIELPSGDLQPGKNQLTFEANLEMEDPCAQTSSDSAWMRVLGTSTLDLDYQISRDGILETLRDPLEPFFSRVDLSNVRFVLPETPSLKELDGAIKLAWIMGESTSGSGFTPRVSLGDLPEDDIDSYHLLVIGLPSTNDVIGQINPYLYQPFVDGEDSLQQVVGNVTYRLPENFSLGEVQLIRSPWNENRAVTLVSGTTEEGVAWAINSMVAEEPYTNLTFIGDTSIENLNGEDMLRGSIAAIESVTDQVMDLSDPQSVPATQPADLTTPEEGGVTQDEYSVATGITRNVTLLSLGLIGAGALIVTLEDLELGLHPLEKILSKAQRTLDSLLLLSLSICALVALNACGPKSVSGEQIGFSNPTQTKPSLVTNPPGMETSPPIHKPSMESVQFTELDGYITNPFMGWQDSRLENEILTETVAYDRFNWAELNPEPNVYDWSAIEQLRTIKGATGRLISFRIRTTRPAPFGPGPVIPDWVTNLGARRFISSEGVTEPLYSDCVYLETHAQFIEALRLRFDGDPDLAFIDIGSYGYYGEWDSPQYDEQIGSLDWHARRRILDMYIGGSGTRPCKNPDESISSSTYTYPGFRSTQLIMPYTPWFEDSLIYVLEKRNDVGIRNDALGSERHQESMLQRAAHLFEQTWPQAPIIFEFAAQSFTPEALIRARDFARLMHASYIHDNLDGLGELEQIEAVVEIVGYRLVLQEARFQSQVPAGDTLQIELYWINRGAAPAYNPYALHIVLSDDTGSPVFHHTMGTDIRTWLPDISVTLNEALELPADILPGLYQLKLAIVDDSGMPVVTLANNGRDADGYYPLGLVQITP
jgi:hypothetical protein